ncbi:MAG: type VI secretion system tip protein VgrG [Pseudomonadales bacterium]|nr:type VI secretion system tip protein VgrG [Pseudomonadales bacterium]
MSQYTQETHTISVETGLGEDVLLLQSFSGVEELSRLFSFELSFLSERDDIEADEVVGKSINVVMKRQGGEEPRYFNGFVSRFTAQGVGERGMRIYTATMVPWLWFLTRTTDCKVVALEKNAIDIITSIFDEFGFSDYEVSLHNASAQAVRELCIQYRETAFDFVSRLMEEEGIFYFFRQEKNKHTLVLADSKGAFQNCPENSVEYCTGEFPEPHISHLDHHYNFVTGKWAQSDYNFETPTTNLETKTNTIVSLPGISQYEKFDYPGEYESKSEGSALTKIRMEENESGYDEVEGESDCRTFYAGGKFTISEHPFKSEKGKAYTIVEINHLAIDGTYSASPEGEQSYGNRFRSIPDSVEFRPQRTTDKPQIHGTQTAVVVGKAGEEIDTDQYGRIKIQFHWDRYGQKDDNSSCWVRFATGWAGKKWGMISIPRIGQEVVVSFLEGDPDRPIVIGSVYNATHMPPYELPANKTQSGVKTHSSKDGAVSNFNEIRFEDKLGSEELFVQAEKDNNINVKNDQSTAVGSDQSTSVGNNQTTSVGNNQAASVGGNRSMSVTGNQDTTISGNNGLAVSKNDTSSVGGNRTMSVSGNHTESVDKDQAISIGKDLALNVGGTGTISVAKDMQESYGAKHTHTVEKEFALKAKKILIDADDEIVLKTGSAKITMKKNGDITIEGKNIKLKGSGNIVMKGKKIFQN